VIDIDTSIYVNEIERRGGETTIFSTPYGCGRSKGFNIPLQCVNTTDGGLVLLRAEGWRFYSRNFGVRKASIAYLCGSDDNGPWAVRVPGTCTSATAALDWHTPVEAKQALAKGHKVVRQGDVWVIEKSTRGRDDAETGAGLPRTHSVTVDGQGRRRLVHTPAAGERKHRAVYLPRGPVGFAVGNRLETRRGGASD